MSNSRQQRPAVGAENEARRPIGYWAEFNNWWRTRLSEHGCRPSQAELAEWFDINAPLCWRPEDMPSLKEVRTHAKCLRSTEQVRNYFRKYRAARKAGSTSVRTVAASDSDSEETMLADSAAVSQSRTVGSLAHHTSAQQPSRSVASHANGNVNASANGALANPLSSLMPFVFGAGGSASLFSGALANLALQAAAAAGTLPPPACPALSTCTTGATAASPSRSVQLPAKSSASAATAAAAAAAAATAQQSLQALQALGRATLAQHGAAFPPPGSVLGLPPRQPVSTGGGGHGPSVVKQQPLPPVAAAVSGPVISFTSSGLPQHSAHGPGPTRSIGGGIVVQLPQAQMQCSGSGASSTSVRMQGSRTPSKHASAAPMAPPAKRQALQRSSCSHPTSSVPCLDTAADTFAAPGTAPPTAPAVAAPGSAAMSSGLYGTYMGTTCFPPSGTCGTGPAGGTAGAAAACANPHTSASAPLPRPCGPVATGSQPTLTSALGLGVCGNGSTDRGDGSAAADGAGLGGICDDDAIVAVMSPCSHEGHEDAFFTAWQHDDMEDLLMDLPVPDEDRDKDNFESSGAEGGDAIMLPLPTALPISLPLSAPTPEPLSDEDEDKAPAPLVLIANSDVSSGTTAPAPSCTAGLDNGRTVTTGAVGAGPNSSTAMYGNAPPPMEPLPPTPLPLPSQQQQQPQQVSVQDQAHQQLVMPQLPRSPQHAALETAPGQPPPPPLASALPGATTGTDAATQWRSQMPSSVSDIVTGLPPIRTRSPVEAGVGQGRAVKSGQEDGGLTGLQLFAPPPPPAGGSNPNAPKVGGQRLASVQGGAYEAEENGLSPDTASKLFDLLDLPAETPLMPSSPLPAAPPRLQPQQLSQQTQPAAPDQPSHLTHQKMQSHMPGPLQASAAAPAAATAPRDDAGGALHSHYSQSMYPPQWMAPPYGYPYPHPHPDHPASDPASSVSGQPSALPPTTSSALYPSMCSGYPPYSMPHQAPYMPYGYGTTAPYHPQYPYYYPPGPSSSYDMYGWPPYHLPPHSTPYAMPYPGSAGYPLPPSSHPHCHHHPAGELLPSEPPVATLRSSSAALGPPEASSQRVRAAAAARINGANQLSCLPPPMPAEPLMPGRYVWLPTAGTKKRNASTVSAPTMAEGGGEFGAPPVSGATGGGGGGEAVSTMQSGAVAAVRVSARAQTAGAQGSYCSRGHACYSQSVGGAKAVAVMVTESAEFGGDAEECVESWRGSGLRPMRQGTAPAAAAAGSQPPLSMQPPPSRSAVQRAGSVEAAAAKAGETGSQTQVAADSACCQNVANAKEAAPRPQPPQQAAVQHEGGTRTQGQQWPPVPKDMGAEATQRATPAGSPNKGCKLPALGDSDTGIDKRALAAVMQKDSTVTIPPAAGADAGALSHPSEGAPGGPGSAYDDADLLDLSSITAGLFSPPASAVQTSQVSCGGVSQTWVRRAAGTCTAATSAPSNPNPRRPDIAGTFSVEATPNAAAASTAAAASAFAFTPIQAYVSTRSHAFAAPPPPPPRFNTCSSGAVASTVPQHPQPPSSAEPATDPSLDTSLRRLQHQLATPHTVGSPLDCSLLASWLASPASIATFDVCARLSLDPSPGPGLPGLGPSPGSDRLGHHEAKADGRQGATSTAPNGSKQSLSTSCTGREPQQEQPHGLQDEKKGMGLEEMLAAPAAGPICTTATAALIDDAPVRSSPGAETGSDDSVEPCVAAGAHQPDVTALIRITYVPARTAASADCGCGAAVTGALKEGLEAPGLAPNSGCGGCAWVPPSKAAIPPLVHGVAGKGNAAEPWVAAAPSGNAEWAGLPNVSTLV